MEGITIDSAKTGITIGVLVASVLLTHVVITAVSNWKA